MDCNRGTQRITTKYLLNTYYVKLLCPVWLACGEGNGTLLQYSCLENPMDGEALWAVVHGVARSRTWLSDFTFTFHFHALEKARATHSSALAWRIPGTGEPVGLLFMGSHRVGHDWSDLAAAAYYLRKQAYMKTKSQFNALLLVHFFLCQEWE